MTKTETDTITIQMTPDELHRTQMALRQMRRRWENRHPISLSVEDREIRLDTIYECEAALLAIDEAEADHA